MTSCAPIGIMQGSNSGGKILWTTAPLTVSDIAIGSNATADIEFNRVNGTYQYESDPGPRIAGTKYLSEPVTGAGQFRVKASLVSGVYDAGGFALDTWHDFWDYGTIDFLKSQESNGLTQLVLDITVADQTVESEVTKRVTFDADLTTSIGEDWDGSAINLSRSSASEPISVNLTVKPDGTYAEIMSDIVSYSNKWETSSPNAIGSRYKIKWNQISGDAPTNNYIAEDVWVSLSSEKVFEMEDTDGSTINKSGVIDVTIRDGDDVGTEVTRRVTLTAEFEDDNSTIGDQWDGSTIYILTASDSSLTKSGLKLRNDGVYEERRTSGITSIANQSWETNSPTSPGANYECKWVHVSGDLPTVDPGAQSIWLPLSSDRLWEMEDADPGASTKNGVFDVFIREIGNDLTTVERRVTLIAEYVAIVPEIGLNWDGSAETLSDSSTVSTVFAELKLESDGTLLRYKNGLIYGGDWETDNPSTVGGNYEVKWEQISGDTPGITPGAESSWLPLSSDRRWRVTDSDGGSSIQSAVLDITIRKIGDVPSEVTRRFTLTADFDQVGNVGVDWTTAPLTLFSEDPATSVTCSLTINPDGTFDEDRDGTVTVSDWETLTPITEGSEYEVKWVTSSGEIPTNPGTQDVWLSLSSARTWSLIDPDGALSDWRAEFNVTIREVGNAASEVTRLVTLNPKFYIPGVIGLDWTVAAASVTATDAVAQVDTGLTLQPDGTYEEDRNGTITHKDWESLTPLAVGADYEMKWFQTSGDGFAITPGAENTWLTLNTDRQWKISDADVGSATADAEISVTIRKLNDAPSEIARTITFQSNYEAVAAIGNDWDTTQLDILVENSSGPLTAYFRVSPNGTYLEGRGVYAVTKYWETAALSTDGSLYEVKWDQNSGSVPTTSMTEATWYPLSSFRQLEVEDATYNVGFVTANITVTIREVGNAVTEVARVVVLKAEWTNAS